MGWTGLARMEHNRESLRYPGDSTDRRWALTAPFSPAAKSGGRRRVPDMREVVNALLYVGSGGGACRNAGLFEAINTVPVMNLREIEGRDASPSAGVIDSQSGKTTESGGLGL